MTYEQISPSPAARTFVECYWVLRHDGTGPALPQRIVPDGRPELILNFEEPFESFQDGSWRKQRECFVAGQITAPMLVRPNGRAQILGVRFRPDGLNRLLSISMQELTEKAVPIEELSGSLSRALGRMRDLPSTLEQIAYFERLFASMGFEDALVSCAVDEIMRRHGAVEVSALARAGGISSRQFERRFQNRVGMPPKLFCRIRRFQKIFRVIESGRMNWAEAALECGYYDQAHLIRDFQELGGETPRALLANGTDLAAYFIESLSASHLSNTRQAHSR